MSKFLKVVVNIILISAIVVAAGLLIPPFAGVTTVAVDDVDMDTNLARGSVTYAVDVEGTLKEGNKVLLNEEENWYIYEITAVNGETYTLEDKMSTDGGVQEKTLGSSAKKVLLTVPFIGYVSMALRTTEGLIIVGLAVIFVIILFILAEIWKNDDEEEEDEDEDEEDVEESDADSEDADDDEEDEEEPRMSRRQQKKAEKAAAKKAAKAAKKARKSGNDFDDLPEEDAKEEKPVKKVEAEPVEEQNETEAGMDLFEETRNSLAADIASMMGLEAEEILAEPEVIPEEETVEEVILPEPQEMPEEKKLAMPVYTKEELMNKAKAAGDEPHVLEDEVSGVTLLDYSDIL